MSDVTGYDHNHPGGGSTQKIPSGSFMPLDMPEYRNGDVGFAKYWETIKSDKKRKRKRRKKTQTYIDPGFGAESPKK